MKNTKYLHRKQKHQRWINKLLKSPSVIGFKHLSCSHFYSWQAKHWLDLFPHSEARLLLSITQKNHLLTLKNKSDSSGENFPGQIQKMIPGCCPASRTEKAHGCTRKQLCRQGHGVLMNKSNNCQQCAPVGKAASQMWVCTKEIVVSRSRGVALPPLLRGCRTTAEYSSAVHGSEILWMYRSRLRGKALL